MNSNDPLEHAFELLQARSRERANPNLDLEEQMMNELGNSKRRRNARLTKIAASFAVLVVCTGTVVASGGLQALFDWASLSGILNLNGSDVYVEDGRVISGEVVIDGATHDVVDGQILDSDGNAIGEAGFTTVIPENAERLDIDEQDARELNIRTPE